MTNTVTTVVGGVLLMMILAGLFALAWHGTISGGECLTAIGGIAAGALGAISVHAGVKAGAAATTSPTAVRSPGP